MPQKFEDLTGQRFGRLVALRKYEVPSKTTRWVCRCDCGNTTKSFKTALKNGTSKSCGCLRGELSRKRNKAKPPRLVHGMSKTQEHFVWQTMLNRCRNPSVKSYERYGGRGIQVCERWLKFENFIADMGPRPSPKHSIERRDNDGDYEPSNCHWATVEEQVYNKRTTLLLDYKGSKITVLQAVRIAGISRANIMNRLYNGWSVARTIETPLRR